MRTILWNSWIGYNLLLWDTRSSQDWKRAFYWFWKWTDLKRNHTMYVAWRKKKNLSPCHKYLCKWNLRASNEKRQKLSQSEQIVFKSFGSHEFHDRVLRLKTEVTADFFMGISENLWNANEFLDNWKNEILIFILKTQKEEKPPETLNQSI